MGRSDTYHAIIVAPARHRALGVARILFGLAWAVDAFFKWHPAFFNNFSSYLSGALQGQAPWVVSWLNFWIDMVKGTPSTFGIIVAIAETAIAIGLIFGLFSNIVDVGGGVLALIIWSTAEGFGGPYATGSTDVGTAIIYAILFLALFATRAGMCMGVDRVLTPRLGKFGFLASGPLPHQEAKPQEPAPQASRARG